ncbi:MAG: acyltransferase [Bacteroidia bacterium]|nr:acyltransferase [Bacteroidia bacterium]
MDKIYFKGLNELRAFAALGVVWHHIELYKFRANEATLSNTPLKYLIEHLGKNGVYLFFVLSGFLITYLLLAEIAKKGEVSLKKFYVRRILRIWPIYYAVILFAFFALPYIGLNFSLFEGETYYRGLMENIDKHFWLTFFFFFFFMPNAIYGITPVAGATQAWSVGVEEQFYLIWPFIINQFRQKAIYVLMGIVVVVAVSRELIPYVPLNRIMPDIAARVIRSFIVSFKIDLMAIGGIGAFLYFQKNETLMKWLDKPILIWGNIILILILLAFQSYILLLAVCFLILILSVITGKLNIYNKTLSFLGVISYGMYMVHPIVMFFCFAILHKSGVKNVVLYNVLAYTMVVGFTILISHLSYQYFESYFLKFKDKFAVILSTNKQSD